MKTNIANLANQIIKETEADSTILDVQQALANLLTHGIECERMATVPSAERLTALARLADVYMAMHQYTSERED